MASMYEKYFVIDDALKEYFSKEWTVDSTLLPMRQINQWFTSEGKKLDRCILYGGSQAISLLFPACDFCKEIIVIDFLENNLQYVRRWMKNVPMTFNWSETIKHIFECEEEREFFIEKEKKTKNVINQLIKIEVTENGPVAPKCVPQADVIISPWTLFLVCQDIDSFTNSVKEMSSLLKVGGHLLMHLVIECTFFYVSKIMFPVLYEKENNVIQVLTNLGYTIKDKRQNPRTTIGKFDIMDYSYILFIDACKECEVQ